MYDNAIESDLNLSSSPDYPFLKSLKLDDYVVSRLSDNLKKIELGSNLIIRSAFCRDIDSEIILKRWDAIFNNNLNSVNSTLQNLEMLNRDKFGPRSISVPYKERAKSIKSYFEDRNKPINIKIDEKLFPSHSLRPISPKSAAAYLKSSTNSGLPFYRRKGVVKDRVLDNLDVLLHNGYPCVLFTRTQEKAKTRDVWGYPIADTLEEMRYYRPVLKYQKNLFWRSALRGPVDVDRSITEMIRYSQSKGLKILSIDFKSFDSSVSDDLISKVFLYISRLFIPSERGNLLILKDRFNTIPIVTPEGVLTGSHGIPSGSTFTNEVGSLVQYIIAVSCGFDPNISFQIQGDDGVYIGTEDSINRLVQAFKACGLNVNNEKSYLSDTYCVYLQCLHHPDYVNKNNLFGGVYPTYRALNRIIHQERWSDFEDFDLSGVDYYSIRTISILENCKNHPLFEELVRFVYSLDKYNLGFSKRGVTKYDTYISNTTGVGGLLVNQYGDDVRGIYNFETVKLLKRLSKE